MYGSRKLGLGAAVLALAIGATVGVTTASASPQVSASPTATTTVRAQAHQAETTQGVITPNTTLTYRGSYPDYYSCFSAGFTGVYYGWWTTYICQVRSGTPGMDLYAG